MYNLKGHTLLSLVRQSSLNKLLPISVLDTKVSSCSNSTDTTGNVSDKFNRLSMQKYKPVLANNLLVRSSVLGLHRQQLRSFVTLDTSQRSCAPWRGVLLISACSISCPSMSARAMRDPDEVVMSHPTKGELVYIGTLARMVRFVKLFSLSTSVMGICIQPMIYDQVAELHWALALMVGSVASFFVFITPLLLHLVTKRYVTRMYWDKDNGRFTATTYSILLRELDHSFTAKEVSIPSIPGLFTTVRVEGGKRPLFLDPNLFLSRDALIHLLKYNEPLDWETAKEQPDSDDEDDPPIQKSEKEKSG